MVEGEDTVRPETGKNKSHEEAGLNKHDLEHRKFTLPARMRKELGVEGEWAGLLMSRVLHSVVDWNLFKGKSQWSQKIQGPFRCLSVTQHPITACPYHLFLTTDTVFKYQFFLTLTHLTHCTLTNTSPHSTALFSTGLGRVFYYRAGGSPDALPGSTCCALSGWYHPGVVGGNVLCVAGTRSCRSFCCSVPTLLLPSCGGKRGQ